MKTMEIQKELMMSYTGYVGTYTSEKSEGIYDKRRPFIYKSV